MSILFSKKISNKLETVGISTKNIRKFFEVEKIGTICYSLIKRRDSMGTSATRANARYKDKAYERVYLQVKKGEKDRLKEFAESVGMSVNSFVLSAVEEKIEQLNKKD